MGSGAGSSCLTAFPPSVYACLIVVADHPPRPLCCVVAVFVALARVSPADRLYFFLLFPFAHNNERHSLHTI